MSQARRALLIINRRHDSPVRVREIVDQLATFDILADVRLKVSNSHARRAARLAAKLDYPLVIAAGGDGTVESVAAGLIGTDCVLGIIPLGTYNNVATCLGIPPGMREACALIASGSPHPIDAGQVRVRESKTPRIFFETCAVGPGEVPNAVGTPPKCTQIRLDGRPPRWVDTTQITVSNAPHSGAPEARMDDALLDVCIHEEVDDRVHHARAVSVRIRSTQQLSVAADSKLIGTTPARIAIRAAALLAIVGPGAALRLRVPDEAAKLAPVVENGVAEATAPETSLAARQPSNGMVAGARILLVPIATALVLKALPPIVRAIQRQLSHR